MCRQSATNMDTFIDGISIHIVPRDGNCMFSSVANFINKITGIDQMTQEILRIIASSYISEENMEIVRDDMFSESDGEPPTTLHELVENVTQDLWGGESTLLSLVNFIQDHLIADFAFLIVHPQRDTTKIGSGRFCCCLRLEGNHYDLLGGSDDLASVILDSDKQVWLRSGREVEAPEFSDVESVESVYSRRKDFNPFWDI
jgi:hypothetical protein